MSRGAVFFRASVFLCLAIVLGLALGAAGGWDPEIIFSIRLPRVLLAVGAGAGLAVAGLILQAVFSNPLCEPYTLGISSGAALGAVLALGSPMAGILAGAGVSASALLGTLVFCAVLLGLSSRSTGGTAFLLVGVMLQYFGASLVTLWMAVTDPSGVQAALYWLLGDLSRARLESAVFLLCGVTFLTLWLGVRARHLDALLLGDQEAAGLGVDPHRVRQEMVLVSSLIVALCVSQAGMIGFVGFLVPHFCRRWVGALHGRLIGLVAVVGAGVLVLSDALARVSVRPFEIPVGVITGLIGAPLFVMMYSKRQGGAR